MDTTSTEAADLATLLDVASRVSMTLELGPLLRLILDQLKVVADYSGSSICVVEGDDLCIMESRGGSAADREEAILGVRLPLSRGGEFWQRLAQGEPVVIDDVRGPSAMAAAYRRFVGTHFESEAIRYIRSFLAVPLRHRDQVIGLITLSKAEPHVYTSRHAHLAGAVAVHAAAAIANARLYEEVRNAQAASARQVERLQTLMAITKELLIATEVERVLDLIVAAAARLVTAAGATLGLIEDGTEQIAIAAIAGEPQSDSTAAASNVVVPILDDGVPIGILRVYDDISRTFVDDDVRLVQSLANLGALVIAHARLLARGNDAAVLEERARLARDLHDSVTQSLFSLGMLARAAHRQFELQDVRLHNTLERVADLAHDSLVEMRALLFELHPASLAEKGLSQALSDLITSGGREEGPRISFTSTMTAQPKPETTVAMFRIVQEALTNARKHAHAASICVTLAETDGQVVLTVADDGVGFDPAGPRPVTADARSGGMGMRSMRERAEAAGLTLTVHSAPGAGTAVLVAAPIGGDDTAIVETTPN